jgi:pimeloyl-[acyl-carrier protein] methyl ester esterase
MKLLLIPGWGMQSFVWSPLRDRLSKDFELLYVEWQAIKSIADHKARIAETVEANGLKSCSLLGWSLGSLAALEFAMDYPSIVKSLILIAGTARFSIDKSSSYRAGWPGQVLQKMKSRLSLERDVILEDFCRSMFSKSEKEKGCEELFFDNFNESARHTDDRMLHAGLEYLMEIDLRQDLKSITAPTLLIHGEQDRICPPAASEYLSNLLPGRVMLRIVHGAGHIPFFTEPVTCAEYIGEFTNQGLDDD